MLAFIRLLAAYLKPVRWYVLLGAFSSLSAQQTAPFPQNFNLHPLANPAILDPKLVIAGAQLLHGELCWRQPLQFPEGPRTDFAHFDYYHTKQQLGWVAGAQFYQFNTDPIYQTRFSGRFALYRRVGNERAGWLAVAVSAGWLQYAVKTEKLIPIFPNDPVVLATTRQIGGPALGAGAYYLQNLQFNKDGNFERDYVFGGFSLPQIGLPQNADKSFRINQVTHYYFLAGMTKEVVFNNFLEPVFLLKKVKNVPWYGQLNLRYLYDVDSKQDRSPLILLGFGIAGTGMMQVEAGIEIPWTIPLLARVAYSFAGRDYQSLLTNVLELSISSRLRTGRN